MAKTKLAKSKFSQWYEKNAPSLNKRRRKRYRTDQKYRDKQLKSTKRWRQQRKKQLRDNPPPPVKKTHFTISEAAGKIGCDIQTIRLLERKGLLPAATDGRKHRVYTEKQIGLMLPLIAYRQTTHYKARGYGKQVQVLSKRAFKGW